MGHSIQAIVASSSVADYVCTDYPQLTRVEVKQGFVILPVDADFIDTTAVPHPAHSSGAPELPPGAFMLLTHGFRVFIRGLSRHGRLAYLETDYFGGVGQQGAMVCDDGAEVMEPAWSDFGPAHRSGTGPINRALKLLGVKRPFLIGDRFCALGLNDCRHNEDLIEQTDTSKTK
jgi:hypothetical protein